HPPPPGPPPFPYTTLFRSGGARAAGEQRGERGLRDRPPHEVEHERRLCLRDGRGEVGPAGREGGGDDAGAPQPLQLLGVAAGREDRKSTRLNSSHVKISYA